MSGKTKIADYFVKEVNPYTQKRTFSVKKCIFAVGGVVLVLVIVVLIYPTENVGPGGAGTSGESIERRQPQNAAPPVPGNGYSDLQYGLDSGISLGSTGLTAGPGVAQVNRQRDLSQVIRRDGGGDKLPLGTLLPARLLNAVSSATQSPVIAEILRTVKWKGLTVIPQGTKAFGEGSLDERNKRLLTRFSTLVFPSGEEFPISASATMPDGSAGIAGDYTSGEFKKQGGRFLGNFLGGMAEGLKEKGTAGEMGMVYEPGNLKNGILNGLQISALDWAKAHSEAMQNEPPYIEVKGGVGFLIYLERAFSP